jgi:threonine dehydratase
MSQRAGDPSAADTPAAAVSPERIGEVAAIIGPYVRVTPIIRLDRADFGLQTGPLVLKLEQLQHTGSFKARGAFANLLLRAVPPAGVVAASGGNHGAAVAFAARALGVPAHIFVPTVSSPAKIASIREYGADLVVHGDSYEDALRASQAFTATSGALPIHAFDQVETVLGAGSVACELQQQAPDATTVMTAVGGGGLLSGTAARYAGAVRIISVEPEGAPTLSLALQAGHPVPAPVGSVAVDSLAPRAIGALPYQILSSSVDQAVLVSDEAILEAQHRLWQHLRLVAEPGGCAALAALLCGRYLPAADEVVVVVVSGANTSIVELPAP